MSTYIAILNWPLLLCLWTVGRRERLRYSWRMYIFLFLGIYSIQRQQRAQCPAKVCISAISIHSNRSVYLCQLWIRVMPIWYHRAIHTNVYARSCVNFCLLISLRLFSQVAGDKLFTYWIVRHGTANAGLRSTWAEQMQCCQMVFKMTLRHYHLYRGHIVCHRLRTVSILRRTTMSLGRRRRRCLRH